jgi:lipopolysaccharide biosynthesis regulator YciM
LTLAETYRQRGETDKMLNVLDRLSEAMPEAVIPTNNWQINMAIGQLYELGHRPEEMKKRLDLILNGWNFTASQRLQFASYYERLSPAAAESLVRVLAHDDPNMQGAATWLAGYYARQMNIDSSRAILNRWISAHPEDEQAKQMLRQLQAFVLPDTSSATDGSGAAPVEKKK